MDNLNTKTLQSNRKLKINFAGGELSSDAGLLLLKEFAAKTGFLKLVKSTFKTTDTAVRFHQDSDNLMQIIWQIITAYFEDDRADELAIDPVFTSVLEKSRLASQPTLSRFYNRLDDTTLGQLEKISKAMRDSIYSIRMPLQILLDLDSTLLDTYGSQEGAAFNFHYQANGYHPLLCYDSLTGDLIKAELRDGTQYCCNGASEFMQSVFDEYLDREIPLFLRGDSGFADHKLYKTCEENNCFYAIRMKESGKLRKMAAAVDDLLYQDTVKDSISYAVRYGEFMYQASTWEEPRRIVCKIEKPYGQMIHLYTFVVTNMDSTPEELVRFYCKRGTMENLIKEGKSGFDFSAVSSHSRTVNANRLQIHVLAYNLFNWFRRIVLPASMRKLRVDTIRLKLLKIAAKAVKSARYITFKLCSSCPYMKEFYETLDNINGLQIQLE